MISASPWVIYPPTMLRDPHRQTKLRHGATTLVANLPAHPGLKPGNAVTLRDDPRRWEILAVSPHARAKSQLNLGWENNI
jgi:hypothetical protein